jgi:uncharacterized protein (TIGR03435 family)
MRKLVRSTYVLAALALSSYGQTFETASIKLIPADGRGPTLIEPHPGTLMMRNVGVGEMVMWSFKLGPGAISNPEVLMGTREHFDINAKAAGPAKTDELRVMMQALLKERFGLVTHVENKTVSAFALVEAKGGHKLKPSESDEGNGVLPIEQPGRMALGARSATLDQLAMFLSMPLRAPVVDMTGLKGRYDFELDLTSYLMNAGPSPGDGRKGGGREGGSREGMPAPPDPISILQQALPEQLGLKLESRKLPIDMVVIDHLNKLPTEN